MSEYINLISPRSRVPIVLTDGEDESKEIGNCYNGSEPHSIHSVNENNSRVYESVPSSTRGYTDDTRTKSFYEINLERGRPSSSPTTLASRGKDADSIKKSNLRQSLAIPHSHSTSAMHGGQEKRSTVSGYPGSILRSQGGSALESLAGDLLTRTPPPQSRAEEEASNYKRRLESYRQAQHQQALLVARLQSKLLQYRQRCSSLENKLADTAVPDLQFGSPVKHSPSGDYAGRSVSFASPLDMEDAVWKLDQERTRNESLLQLNRDLRSELDETRKVNNCLSGDLQKLSDDWEKLTRQMNDRESQWKAEEQAYSDYYASEHTKLLQLWKKVSATKRDFEAMKSTTGRDLAQLRNNFAKMCNRISSGVISATVSSVTPQQEAETAALIGQMNHDLMNAKNTQENLRRQLKDRDDRIQTLEETLGTIDNKAQTLEKELTKISTHDLATLQNSLKEIGKLVISDFEHHGLEDGHDVHLTSAPAIFIYDEAGENASVFAESIVSAVQAALNKRQLQLHQVQVNLGSAKEQNTVARSHAEALEQDLSKSEEKCSQLVDSNEKLKDGLEHLKMERDGFQRAVDSLKNEKTLLDQQRRALLSELESTVKMKNSIATNLSRCEKVLEVCRDEASGLRSDLEKTKEELIFATQQLQFQQDMNLKFREQINALNDSKEKNSSEMNRLKSSLNEMTAKYEDLVFQFERSEDSLKKAKMDTDVLAEKLRSGNEKGEGLEKERKKLFEKLRELEDLRSQLETELQDTRNDVTSLRREILELERTKTDLEGKMEKETARADTAEGKLAAAESQIEVQREEYLRELQVTTERAEMLSDELAETRREADELEQLLDKTRSELANVEKMHSDAIVIIEDKENAIKNLNNVLERAREEKMSLEELETTLKTALIEKDNKIEGLQKSIHTMKEKQLSETEHLKEKLNRTLANLREEKLKAEEEKSTLQTKYTQELASLKSSSGQNEEKLKSEYEEKLKNLRTELENENKNDSSKFSSEIASLRTQLDNTRVQYEEALLRSENDKQQGLLLAQQDQQGLSDKIRLLEKELEDSKNDRDRLKRECEQKCNHEKNTSATLRSELIKLKNELESTKQCGEDNLRQIESRLNEIDKERDSALMQVEDMRGKLRSAEERETDLKRELSEVSRKLKDTDSCAEQYKRDLVDLRKTIAEMTEEKEKTNSYIESMKKDMNKRDDEISNLKKDLNKSTLQLKNIDRVKSDLESELAQITARSETGNRERIELENQVSELKEHLDQYRHTSAKLEGEITELKVKLEAETERRDNAEAQWRATKKLLEDVESDLNLARSEEERLTSKIMELEEKYVNRENQLIDLVDDNKVKEKKLQEEKHNLTISLNSVQQQMESLKTKLQSTENRLKYLTEEKSELEGKKKEVESKLNQITSGFKRLGIVGIGGGIESPEGARRMMTALQTQMASLQQDRDTLAAKFAGSQEALRNVEQAKSRLEDQLDELNRDVQTFRTDCKGKENQLSTLQKDITLKSNELTRLAERVAELEDSVKAKENVIRSLKADKESMKDDWERARQKWEEGKTQQDSKWAKAEVNMRALEGDLNRTTLVLQQKDAQIYSLEEKINYLQKSNSDLEERCGSLTMTIEQLNMAIEKATSGEQEWKDKYHNLNRSASENSSQLTHLNEKIRALQRDKNVLEQEKNNLNEKWEGISAAAQDYKRQIQNLSDKNGKLRLQMEEITRSSIDKQLKMALSDTGKEDVRFLMAEKLEMSRRIDNLNEKVRELERENKELERLKESTPLKGVPRVMPMSRDNTVTVLEEENSDLRRKITKLESEIRDLERRHTKHIAEVSSQVRQEKDFELERARAAKLQAERLLEARESSYRQQVQRLEQQVAHLKEQLNEEIRRRQQFLSRSFRSGQELRSLRQTLGDSLRNVTLDPNPSTLDSEARRLDSALDLHKSSSQSSLLSPHVKEQSPGMGSFKRDLSPAYPRTH